MIAVAHLPRENGGLGKAQAEMPNQRLQRKLYPTVMTAVHSGGSPCLVGAWLRHAEPTAMGRDDLRFLDRYRPGLSRQISSILAPGSGVWLTREQFFAMFGPEDSRAFVPQRLVSTVRTLVDRQTRR